MADDKKFGNNDFEDIYSSSEKNGYEDIYSDSEEEGRAVSSDKKGDDDFEDFFTGRDDKSDNVESENETPVPRHREINTSPEVKPSATTITEPQIQEPKRFPTSTALPIFQAAGSREKKSLTDTAQAR